jgi:hypothetical protein
MCQRHQYGDVSMTNLPEQILINAGSYSAGLFFMTLGKSRSQTMVTNCQGNIYAQFAWSSGMPGHLLAMEYIQLGAGIGLRVKVWLNISGEYDGDTDDFNADSQVTLYRRCGLLPGQAKRFLITGQAHIIRQHTSCSLSPLAALSPAIVKR